MGSFLRLLFRALGSDFGNQEKRNRLEASGFQRGAMEAVVEAYRRGDYDTALERSKVLRDAGDMASYSFYRGSLLIQVGEEKEAEAWMRRRLESISDARLRALSYGELGHVLMIQQRYDEAMEAFTACLKLWPNRPSSYRNVAECWLRQGDNAGEALKWAMEAVERQRAEQPETEGAKLVHEINLAEELTTLAWAIAANGGDASEVNELVAEAVPLAGEQAVESTAMVHFQAGLAYAVLEDLETSGAYFEEAARVDPQGRWGREARAMMAEVG